MMHPTKKFLHNTLFSFTVSLFCTCFSVIAIAQNARSDSIISLSEYDKVKRILFAEPYPELPQYQVNKRLFGKSGDVEGNYILKAAKRSLNDSRDLIDFPQGQKLLQANGICFTGLWRIQALNNHSELYTGLFSAGTEHRVIVRASVALSGTRQKNKRAFGMAIKFFDETEDASSQPKPSLNAFISNSFGGVIKKHTLDLPMDNEPPLGKLPKWGDLSTALRLRKELERADRAQGAKKPRFSFRPINHLAEYQVSGNVQSPKWLRLSAITSTRVDKDDFRDELRVENYPDQKIVYSLEVADASDKKSTAKWQAIGTLTLGESITSVACDQQLHFKHPSL